MHQDTTDLHHYPSYLFLYTHEFQWQFSLNHLDLNDQMTKRKLQSIRKISNYFLSNKRFMPWSTNPVVTTNRSSKAKEYSTNIAYANQRICFLADLYFVLSLHLLRKKLAFSIVINNPLFVLSQFRLYRPQPFFLSAATHSYKRARFPSSVKWPAANCCQITVGPAASWDDPSWSKNCTWASVIATLSYTSPAFHTWASQMRQLILVLRGWMMTARSCLLPLLSHSPSYLPCAPSLRCLWTRWTPRACSFLYGPKGVLCPP